MPVDVLIHCIAPFLVFDDAVQCVGAGYRLLQLPQQARALKRHMTRILVRRTPVVHLMPWFMRCLRRPLARLLPVTSQWEESATDTRHYYVWRSGAYKMHTSACCRHAGDTGSSSVATSGGAAAAGASRCKGNARLVHAHAHIVHETHLIFFHLHTQTQLSYTITSLMSASSSSSSIDWDSRRIKARLAATLALRDAGLALDVADVESMTDSDIEAMSAHDDVYTRAYARSMVDLNTGRQAATRIDAYAETEWLIHHATETRTMDGINDMIVREVNRADDQEGRNLVVRLRLMDDAMIACIAEDMYTLPADRADLEHLVDAIARVRAERKKKQDA